MIKAIIFDFDGVIVESADIKTDAFRELFSIYPEKIKEIVDYHMANVGISRYVKFRHIYKNILKEKLLEEKEVELGRAFSDIVLEKVLRVPFVLGALEFLNMAKERYLFFIASGTPQDELSDIVNTRGLTAYFTGIYGSPKTKPDIVKQIRSSYGFGNDEIVYVGDAQSDEDAARESGIVFIMRQKEPIGQKYRYWAIKNLFELDAVLRNIEKSFKSSATMR